MNGRQIISIALALGMLAVAGQATAATLEVGRDKPFRTITAAVAAASSGDEIVVRQNGIGWGPASAPICDAIYMEESIDATGKELRIYPARTAGKVCVIGAHGKPAIRFDGSGDSAIEDFHWWLGASAPAIEVSLSSVTIHGINAIAANLDAAILARRGATIDLQRCNILGSAIGLDVRDDAFATARTNRFLSNELAFAFGGETESDIVSNIIQANARVGAANERARSTFVDNVIRGNEDGCVLEDESETVFFNNLWVANGIDDSSMGLLFADHARGQVIHNTFDRNIVGSAIATRGSSLVAVRDTIITNGTHIGITCLSSKRTAISFSDIFNNPTAAIGCPRGEGIVFTDPGFATGPIGDHYLDPRTSPVIDAGSGRADTSFPTGGKTTDPDLGRADIGTVDMGYHYPR